MKIHLWDLEMLAHHDSSSAAMRKRTVINHVMQCCVTESIQIIGNI